MLPETWENIRAGGGHIKKGVLDFSLIIMQGRVDAGVSFAFYKCLYSHGPQATFILLLLCDIKTKYRLCRTDCWCKFAFRDLSKSAKRVNDVIHLLDWSVRGSGPVIDADEDGRETLEEGCGRYQAK